MSLDDMPNVEWKEYVLGIFPIKRATCTDLLVQKSQHNYDIFSLI